MIRFVLSVLAVGCIGGSLSAGVLSPVVPLLQAGANAKKIGLAFHNIEGAFGRLPTDHGKNNGKPLFSWRVSVLPYIDKDGDELFRKFNLDEPWDGENNKKLIPLMPKIYSDPRIKLEPGMTTYKTFTGKDAYLNFGKSKSLIAIQDGSSNTIMLVSAGKPIVWTKPEDIDFAMDKPLPDLTSDPSLLPLVSCFFDGGVCIIPTAMVKNEKNMKLLINPADGQIVDNPRWAK